MKKLLAFMLCAMLMCAAPVVAFAEDGTDEIVTTEEEVPTTEEIVTEGENTAVETVPETELVTEAAPVETEPVTEPVVTEPVVTETVAPDTETAPLTPEQEAQTMSEMIVDWVMASFEEISVIITLILTAFYQIRKHGWLNKSISTLNNNAVVVAEDSRTAIGNALAEVQGVAATVNEYKEMIVILLAEVRQNDEEKKRLETALTQVESYLKTAKLANVELANEVAELLVLANIPMAKKQELYARHLAAVGAITDAENTEVKTDDNGKEE